MIGLGPALAGWAALQILVLLVVAALVGAGLVGAVWAVVRFCF